MRNIIQRVNKAAVMYGLIGVACAVVVGMIGWPYLLSHYGMIAAIVFLGIIIVFSAIAAYGFAAHTHIGVRRGHIDLQVYRRDQLSLPYQQEASTKIVQQEREKLPGRPLKKLPGFLPLSSGKSSGNLPVESGNYIDSLPLDKRIANAYHRFPEKSNRELAQMCGCSHPMVGQWKKRNNVQ